MPKLLINEGGQSSVFELFDDEATIGRGASNAIQIVDSHASKHHAVIRRAGGRVKLVDMESKNGTRVNGEFRNQRWLQHGDAVSIGAAVLTYDGSDSVAAEEVPAPAGAFVRGGGGMGGGGGGGVLAAPVSRGAAPRSRRDRERDRDGEEDDDRPRRSSRPSSNSTATVLLVGVVAVVIIGLFIFLMAGKGNPQNTTVLASARRWSMLGGATTEDAKANVQKALDHLLQYGDPSDVDSYVSVGKEIEALKIKLLSFDDTATEEAANKEYKLLENSFIERWKTKKTDEAFGDDLMKWTAKYKGTRAVGAFEAGYKDPKLMAIYKKAKAGGFAPK